jgi:hypothetical protein
MKKQDVGTLSAKILEDLKEQLEIRFEEKNLLLDEISRLEEQVNFYSNHASEPVEKRRRKKKDETPHENPAQI